MYEQLLQGGELPKYWAKGMVRLLEKREPTYQLENLRPVTLLRTVYKLLTGIVNNRLQWELEEQGILEPTQEGFRPGRHTRRAVARVQYFLAESKRTSSSSSSSTSPSSSSSSSSSSYSLFLSFFLSLSLSRRV